MEYYNLSHEELLKHIETELQSEKSSFMKIMGLKKMLGYHFTITPEMEANMHAPDEKVA